MGLGYSKPEGQIETCNAEYIRALENRNRSLENYIRFLEHQNRLLCSRNQAFSAIEQVNRSKQQQKEFEPDHYDWASCSHSRAVKTTDNRARQLRMLADEERNRVEEVELSRIRRMGMNPPVQLMSQRAERSRQVPECSVGLTEEERFKRLVNLGIYDHGIATNTFPEALELLKRRAFAESKRPKARPVLGSKTTESRKKRTAATHAQYDVPEGAAHQESRTEQTKAIKRITSEASNEARNKGVKRAKLTDEITRMYGASFVPSTAEAEGRSSKEKDDGEKRITNRSEENEEEMADRQEGNEERTHEHPEENE